MVVKVATNFIFVNDNRVILLTGWINSVLQWYNQYL